MMVLAELSQKTHAKSLENTLVRYQVHKRRYIPHREIFQNDQSSFWKHIPMLGNDFEDYKYNKVEHIIIIIKFYNLQKLQQYLDIRN